MNDRSKIILNTIIREHIATGEPVASGVLVEKYKLGISPATVRNEMADLEQEGLIIQPHTSSGRIPTEKAYKLFIENIEVKKVPKSVTNNLDSFLAKKDEEGFKQSAKEMAGYSQLAVFWAFHRHNVYYTGISNLLHQPEFRRMELVYDMGEIIDRVDEIVNDIFDDIKEEPKILLGEENPFGGFCGTILAKYKISSNYGMFGILGPMRMDYEKYLGVIKYVLEKINVK